MDTCILRNCNQLTKNNLVCRPHRASIRAALKSLDATRVRKRQAGYFKKDHPELYDRAVIDELRQRLIEQYGERCMACGATEQIIVEHIKSRYMGGTNDPENVQLLCVPCNFIKGHKQTDYRPRS